MKKNLRIASAAAAALLAVAPVAASAVSTATTVSAADLGTEANRVKVPGELVLDRGVNTVFSVSLNDTQKASILQQLGLPSTDFEVESAKATLATNPETTTGVFTQSLDLTISSKIGTKLPETAKGLAQVYGDSNNNIVGADKATKQLVVLSSDNKTPVKATLDARFASQQGVPVFYTADGKTQVVDGSTLNLDDQLENGFSAKTLLDAIDGKLDWFTSASKQKRADLVTTQNDIEKQLVNQGLKRLSNGDFDYPANGFNVTLTAKADNGKSTTITIRVNSKINYNAPVFVVTTTENNVATVQPTVYRDGSTISGLSSAKVALNGTLNQAALKKEVAAYIQSAKGENGADVAKNEVKLADYTVDTSALNTAQKGLYLITLTATNPYGLSTKVYVQVQVGDPTAAQMYVANEGVKVYNINGNVVTETSEALTKGAAVDTYGKVVVNGVEYTRISKGDNVKWVKSSDLTATAPSTAEVTTTKTIWHVAKIYDKDGKPTSEASLHAYNTVSVVSTPVTINGAKYYKLAGKDQYVKAGNIDGTSRTLSHNAYVYKNTGKAKTTKSGKKTKKVLLKKGSQVTTYGSAFTVNGHKMFRIGRNQYVKVANF